MKSSNRQVVGHLNVEMRPKLATHLSPAEVATLNVTSRSFANLNVTHHHAATRRHAPRARDRRGGLVLRVRGEICGVVRRAGDVLLPLLPGRHDPDRERVPLRSGRVRVLLPLRAAVRRAAAAASPPRPPPSSPPPATATLATFCPTPGRPAVAPATAFFRNASVERSGCYLFHRLEAPRAGELDGSAAAASFVLTTTLTPSHNSSILRQQKVYAQLEHVLTTRTVYLVETSTAGARAARRIA